MDRNDFGATEASAFGAYLRACWVGAARALDLVKEGTKRRAKEAASIVTCAVGLKLASSMLTGG